MSEPLPYATPFTAQQESIDRGHLSALAVCHYVWGGLLLLLGCFPLIYLALGIAMLKTPSTFANPGSQPPPQFVGYMFIACSAFGMAAGWALGCLTIYSGRCIHRQRRRLLSFIVAALNCFSVPLGTTLGIFTFIVLAKPTVKALYDGQAMTPP